MAKKLKVVDPPLTHEELADMLDRAERGDTSTLPQLRALFDRQGAEYIDTCCGGDVARSVERKLIGRRAGDNLIAKEAITNKLARLRAEVGGPDPLPLERLAVDRVVLCWLDLHVAELEAAKGGRPLAVATFLEEKVDRAARRFALAMRTLGTLRKMAPAGRAPRLKVIGGPSPAVGPSGVRS